MKKIAALIMVLAMMLSCTAFAEPTLLADFGDENTLVYAREIAYEVADNGLDLKEELQKPDGGCIAELYKGYEEVLSGNSTAYWRSYIPLDDEVLYPYLKKSLCFDGQYYKSNKLLGMREANDNTPISADLQSLKPFIGICRSLSIALWDKQDMDQLEEIINTQIEGKIDEFCIDFELAKLYVKMHKAESKEDYLRIRPDVEAVLQVIPQQGESIKLLGDIEWAAGDRAKAVEYYGKAQDLTSNGLLLLDIQKKKEAYANENL